MRGVERGKVEADQKGGWEVGDTEIELQVDQELECIRRGVIKLFGAGFKEDKLLSEVLVWNLLDLSYNRNLCDKLMNQHLNIGILEFFPQQ